MQIYYLEDFLDYILVTGKGFMADWRMSLSEREIDIFHDSVARARANDVFLDAFYDAFMDSTGDARYHYNGSSLEQVKAKLHSTLKMVAQLKDEEPGYVVMGDIPRINTQFHVSEGMYQLWLEALLKAVSRCDPHFNNYLEDIWRHIVSDAISHMMKVDSTEKGSYTIRAG